jgi:hypothetical protein
VIFRNKQLFCTERNCCVISAPPVITICFVPLDLWDIPSISAALGSNPYYYIDLGRLYPPIRYLCTNKQWKPFVHGKRKLNDIPLLLAEIQRYIVISLEIHFHAFISVPLTHGNTFHSLHPSIMYTHAHLNHWPHAKLCTTTSVWGQSEEFLVRVGTVFLCCRMFSIRSIKVEKNQHSFSTQNRNPS